MIINSTKQERTQWSFCHIFEFTFTVNINFYDHFALDGIQ